MIFSLTASEVGWTEDLNFDYLMLETAMPYLTLPILSWTVLVWLSRRRAVRQSEGHGSVQRRDWVVFGVVFLIVSGLLWWGLTSLPSSGTVFSGARWLVALFGLVTVPGLYFTFPPHQAFPARPRSRRIR
ncbi:hypothetical protein JNB_17708 [Janibacter sp. HTCC2649]|uniref:hypothetical protein n=1 Tax=Janibacter sp. HTCC2649 TaxID=313589 RepID=UPI0000670EC1|nr:hypothetical protein [Janibacter sp. HTCC2649]EAP97330.1 hypothetical protein JNB_17708 [Janibacter sp. HTCC2649]